MHVINIQRAKGKIIKGLTSGLFGQIFYFENICGGKKVNHCE